MFLGWLLYVIALSQGGKTTPLDALGDAVKAVGQGSLEDIHGTKGMGVFSAMVGGECQRAVGRGMKLIQLLFLS